MQSYQPHMKGLTPFRTSLEGVEVIALIDYIKAVYEDDCQFPHEADVRHVIHEGADIYEILKPSVIEIIAARFLADLEPKE